MNYLIKPKKIFIDLLINFFSNLKRTLGTLFILDLGRTVCI